MSKKTYRLDASVIKGAAGCLRKIYWSVVTGYSGRGIYNDMVYGSAVHIFKDVLKKTQDEFKATAEAYVYFKTALASEYFRVKPKKEFLSIGHLGETMSEYIKRFGVRHEKDRFQSLVDTSNDELIVERKFQIPLLETEDHVIYMCGTMDDIGKFVDNNVYAIADEKVTAYYNKEKFFQPFKLSTQLITYAWALRWHIRNFRDKSPLFRELQDKNVGVMINGIFVSKDKPAEFDRTQVIPVQDNLLDEYEVKLGSLAGRLSNFINSNALPMREGILNDACFGKFNEPCMFANACMAPDEEAAWALNDRAFDKFPYNPLQHRDLTKTEYETPSL